MDVEKKEKFLDDKLVELKDAEENFDSQEMKLIYFERFKWDKSKKYDTWEKRYKAFNGDYEKAKYQLSIENLEHSYEKNLDFGEQFQYQNISTDQDEIKQLKSKYEEIQKISDLYEGYYLPNITQFRDLIQQYNHDVQPENDLKLIDVIRKHKKDTKKAVEYLERQIALAQLKKLNPNYEKEYEEGRKGLDDMKEDIRIEEISKDKFKSPVIY